jgi:predicted TIM-barrel enzyme
MTVIAREVKLQHRLPLGINVLRNDAESALAIATAVGAEFIRVNVYTGARLTDQGLIQGVAQAPPLPQVDRQRCQDSGRRRCQNALCHWRQKN